MAEFSEVARQWKRMCKGYWTTRTCHGCPIAEHEKAYEACAAVDTNIAKMEELVMSWAAEHPEPVYPTWLEYLCEIGVIPKVIHCNELYLTAYNGIHDNRIPADIAEKLGIEPKEDV